MKKAALAPTLAPTIALAFALAACGGEPVDGSDTADMTPDAVTADTGSEGASDYEPFEDGPLQSDSLLEDDGATAAEPEGDDATMQEDPAM